MQQMLGAYGFDQFMLPACSYHPLKVRNLVQSKAYTPKSCSSTPWSIEFKNYTSKPLNKFCYHNNFWNNISSQHPFDEKFDLLKIKHDNMNQMIGLEEIFVLPSSKLFVGSPKLREYFLHGKGNIAKIIQNEINEQNKRNDYWNYQVHPPSILSKLFSGKQKSWTTFLEERMMRPYQGNQHSSIHSR